MRFSRSDALFSLIVCALAGILFHFFFLEFNAIRLRDDVPEIGTIIFKKRSASRRQTGTLRWERLQTQVPVYQGDTIRTAEISEAEVVFDDGTILDIFENSMLRLDFDDLVQEFELIGGAVHIGGGHGSSQSVPRSIKIGSTQVEISAGSNVSLLQEGTQVSVDVTEGSVTISSSGGSKTEIAANQEFRLDSEKGTEEIFIRSFIPLLPAQGARLVLDSANKVPVLFSLSVYHPELMYDDVYLQLAQDVFFTEKLRTIPLQVDMEELSIKVPLEEGIWFWRIRNEESELSSVRRFSLVYTQSPELIQPRESATIQYRVKKPQLRFSWATAEHASAYILETARNDAFSVDVQRHRTEQTSLWLTDLDEGQWFWRVNPVYSHDPVGLLPQSSVRSFSILRKDTMDSLQPIIPEEGTLFEIQSVAKNGIAFSWTNESEAVSYELSILDKDRNNLLTKTSPESYLSLAPDAVPFLQTPGKYYWTLRWIDEEGNFSPPAEAMGMTMVDGSIAVNLLFPPNGYTAADSLITNTLFTWKSNISAPTIMQLARDAQFTNLISEEAVTGESTLGKNWPSGKYYWRIRTLNADRSVFIQTDPRSLVIAEPLDAPVVMAPSPGSMVNVLDQDSFNFHWNAVEGADYYRALLYAGTDTGAEPVFEQSYIEETTWEVPLGLIPDGPYMLELQAFTLDTPVSTRIIGYQERAPILLKKILPVELVSPGSGSSLSGLKALREGIRLTWNAPDIPEKLRIKLTRNGNAYPVPYNYSKGDSSFVIEKLPEGEYQWSIHADLMSFNVSSRDQYSFTVLPIPPLPAASLISPENGYVFGPDQLKTLKNILFDWSPVDGATHYIFSLYMGNLDNPILVKERLEATELLLEDLDFLDRGTLIWEIEAQSYSSDGSLDQDGQASRFRFTIDLPTLQAPGPITGVEYYGY